MMISAARHPRGALLLIMAFVAFLALTGELPAPREADCLIAASGSHPDGQAVTNPPAAPDFHATQAVHAFPDPSPAAGVIPSRQTAVRSPQLCLSARLFRGPPA